MIESREAIVAYLRDQMGAAKIAHPVTIRHVHNWRMQGRYEALRRALEDITGKPVQEEG